MVECHYMKIYAIACLCAALAAPSFAQTTSPATSCAAPTTAAEDDDDEEVTPGEQFVIDVVTLQGDYFDVINELKDGNISADDAAAKITAITAKLKVLSDSVESLPAEVLEQIAAVVEDEEISADIEEIDATSIQSIHNAADEEYYGSEALKAALEAYAEVNQYEI